MGMGKRAWAWTVSTGLAVSSAAMSAPAMAQEQLVGQPTPGGFGLQPAMAPLSHEAAYFHNVILLPIITAICLLVLGLLVWIVIRYNKRSNPVPARWSHNTLVEVVWTVVPVLILMFISIFSFGLLYRYNDTPPVDVTVKVTGNQWNWAYEYPDLGVAEYISNMLPEAEARARNVPYRLAADEPMVVPVGKTVNLLVTGADVIHAVGLPGFGLKVDAVPGRVNETWFRAERTGIFYGQCSELCGVDHAFMPIQINVVTQAEFDAWVRSKGGDPARGRRPPTPVVGQPIAPESGIGAPDAAPGAQAPAVAPDARSPATGGAPVPASAPAAAPAAH